MNRSISKFASFVVIVTAIYSNAVGGAVTREPLFEQGRIAVGCNYWASHAGVYMWRNWDAAQVEKDLDLLAAHDMTILRVFPLWPDFQPLTAEYGACGTFQGYSQNGGPLKNYAAVDDEMINRFRFLCDAAEKRGMKLVVGLITGWMSGRLFAPPALEAKNVLTDTDAIAWQCRFVRYIVNSLKDHGAIAAWDLGNECNCMGEADASRLWMWMHAVSSEIRMNDPSRPVVSGMHSVGTARSAKTNMRQQGELVDWLTTHPYPLWTPHCNLEPFDTLRNACHPACETTLYDWPERYRGAAGIAALRGLPAAWKDTRPVAGRCGEFYAVVRESHDGRFYFAATTVRARTIDIDFGFLGDGEWKMTVYADDPARTPSDAKALSVSTRSVRKSGRESFALCDEGGTVAIFEPGNGVR